MEANKQLIIQWIIQKKPGVYGFLIQHYYEEIKDLKTSFAIDYIASDLRLDKSTINPVNFASAKRLYLKDLAKTKSERKKS